MFVPSSSKWFRYWNFYSCWQRGLAYNINQLNDFYALASGVSWWYNWSPNPGFKPDAKLAMDFVPMLWNFNYKLDEIEAMLKNNPQIKHIMVFNESNLHDQANMKPEVAAKDWPKYERLATRTGVKIVGPQMNYGTLAGYHDPIKWMDDFIKAYMRFNRQELPRIDAIGCV